MRGMVEYLCGVKAQKNDAWCKENVRQNWMDDLLNNDVYQLPEFSHKFAIITFTVSDYGNNKKIKPVIRLYLGNTFLFI